MFFDSRSKAELKNADYKVDSAETLPSRRNDIWNRLEWPGMRRKASQVTMLSRILPADGRGTPAQRRKGCQWLESGKEVSVDGSSYRPYLTVICRI